jgi:hypothetical protein
MKRTGRRQPTTTIHRSTRILTLEGKEKTGGNNSESQSSTTFHKGKIFALIDSRAKYEEVHYIKREKKTIVEV